MSEFDYDEPTWARYPDSWDQLIIKASSREFIFRETQVTVDGTLSNKWDVKESAGSDGASEKYRGLTPAKLKVSWVLYTLDHELEWVDLFEKIAPKAGKTAPEPIEVRHPAISRAKLTKFIVNDIDVLKPAGPQMMMASLSLTQWFAQPKASPKAKDAASSDISKIPVANELKPKVPPPPPKPSQGTGLKP